MTQTKTLAAPYVRGPKDLPDLRKWLLDRFAPGTLVADVIPDADWVHDTLSTAKLWWIESETCQVLAESAPSIPADLTLDMRALPTPAGFAVFADDLEGIDANPMFDGHKVVVSAVLWGPVVISDDGGVTMHEGISIGMFSRPRGRARPDLEGLREKYPMAVEMFEQIEPSEIVGDLFTFLGRSDWLIGCGPDELLPGDDAHPTAAASKAEDRRLLAALHALTRTSITSIVDEPIPRHVARRATRHGLDPTVRVLKLGGERVRHPSMAGTSDREWSVQWVVSSHFRWQAHGPGRSERKLILVPAHIKGPDDKPLIHAERVWRVVPPRVAS